jgi:hypothetical protein
LTINITVDQLVELAREAESRNPIEWGEIPVNEDTVYRTFAITMYAAYTNIAPETKDLVLLASIVKLQTENFALSQHNKLLLNSIRELQNNRE